MSTAARTSSIFETFTDLSELRAAYLAAREVTDLPVICSLAFENNGRTLMGTDPFIAVTVLKSLGVDMVGANCSFGPEHMTGYHREYVQGGRRLPERQAECRPAVGFRQHGDI